MHFCNFLLLVIALFSLNFFLVNLFNKSSIIFFLLQFMFSVCCFYVSNITKFKTDCHVWERIGTKCQVLVETDKLETNINMTLKWFPLREYNYWLAHAHIFVFILLESHRHSYNQHYGNLWQGENLMIAYVWDIVCYCVYVNCMCEFFSVSA